MRCAEGGTSTLDRDFDGAIGSVRVRPLKSIDSGKDAASRGCCASGARGCSWVRAYGEATRHASVLK